jgi:orotidine-5'-phosphate decarboxylase
MSIVETAEVAEVVSRLKTKNIPVRDRLIVALDVPSRNEALRLVEEFGDSVQFYKIGLELFMADGYFGLIDDLVARGKKVFADLKIFDISQTVASAVRQLCKHKITFASVHGANDDIIRAAIENKNGAEILAVTVLTSLNDDDMKALGFQTPIKEVVVSRAKRALELGCAGVISSGLEAEVLRSEFGSRFVIVIPGIRPGANREVDDQKRTVDVEEAFENGADYIVVGRPVRNAPNPRAAAEEIQSRIAALFA